MAMAPNPFEFPQPTVSTDGQLVTIAQRLSSAVEWQNGLTWVQYPETAPLAAPYGCGALGYQTVSGDTIADGVTGWDMTPANSGYTFTQLPFNIYRALRNSVLGDISMVGDEQLERANVGMLKRWISIAIAQELITGAASGGIGLVDAAAKVSGIEGVEALGAAMDEYTQLAGAVHGLVHTPTYSASLAQFAEAMWDTGAWDSGTWGGAEAGGGRAITGHPGPRFIPVTDAGYQMDFLRNLMGYGATKLAGFITGGVYFGMKENGGVRLEESILDGNVVEYLSETQAILVFNPLTVVSYIAETASAYSVTASPLAS